MATILVVDDMAIFRDPLAAMLKVAGHSTLIAVNGQEALGIIAGQRVDLVLLDLAMPVMDGITFLERLRADPHKARTPVILLTAVTDRARIVEAAKLGVRDCLLKSQFSSKELLARVQKLLDAAQTLDTSAARRATATTQAADLLTGSPAPTSPLNAEAPCTRLLTREQTLTRVEGTMEVTALSGVVAEVISLAASPRADLSSLSSMISRDAVLSAKVLRVSNSAGYARSGGSVVDINDAVKRIGWTTIRNIAATLGIYDSMPSSSAHSELDFMRCWQHALAVANLCEQLTVQSKSPDDSGVAYLIGLCHDLAEILLFSHFQAEYAQVLECERRTGQRRDLLERQMLGVTHHELISLILEHFGLPEKIRAPIQAFHDPNGGGRAANLPLTKMLHFADAYANGLMLGSQRNCMLTTFTRAECAAAAGAESPDAPEAHSFRGNILSQTMMLARLSRSAERELAAPVFPRAKTRVWLIRDPALSAFDPVSTFLQAIADVRVQHRLPSMAEATEVDSVVAISRCTGNATYSVDELGKLSAMKPCFWAVLKIDGAVPDGCPVQPRLCPLGADELASFVSADAGRAGKIAA